eukprot:m.183649 g.183649  ORF g.183649 m.183649 type:complete len:2074 (+) comp10497_c0_seq1:138-6359(+)
MAGEAALDGARLQQLLSSSETAVRPGLALLCAEVRRSEQAGEACAQLVAEYARAQPDCAAIFAIWDDQRAHHDNEETHLVHEAMACILRSCRRFPPLAEAGTILLRRIISGYMKTIFTGLSSGKIQFIKATLQLLSAMVLLNETSARDVQRVFDFKLKALSTIATKRIKGKDKVDIRHLYIEFALSFLQSPNESVVREVVQTKGFFSPIFSNLAHDSLPTLRLLLGGLTKYLLHSTLPRKTKILVLNASALQEIMVLYKPVTEAMHDDLERTKRHAASARQLAHEFLLIACCDLEHGICFPPQSSVTQNNPQANSRDKPLAGTLKAAAKLIEKKPRSTYNPVLKQCMPTLVSAIDEPMAQELLLRLLPICPELTAVFFQNSHVSYEPRVSLRWMNNMTLVVKILTIPPPPLVLSGPTGDLDARLEALLPAAASRNILGPGLQHSAPLIRMTSLNVIVACLSQLDAIGKQIESTASSPVLAAELPAKREWLAALNRALTKRLPDLQLLLGLHHREAKESPGGFIHVLALKAIGLFAKLLPSEFALSKFDVGKTIPSQVVLAEYSAPAQLDLLRLLHHAPDLRWNNLSQPQQQSNELSHFGNLCQFVSELSCPVVLAEGRAVIYRIFRDTGLFDQNLLEIDVWLDQIFSFPNSIALVDLLLRTASNDPYAALDELGALKSELDAPFSNMPGELSVLVPLLLQMDLAGHGHFVASLLSSVAHIMPSPSLLLAILEGNKPEQVSAVLSALHARLSHDAHEIPISCAKRSQTRTESSTKKRLQQLQRAENESEALAVLEVLLSTIDVTAFWPIASDILIVCKSFGNARLLQCVARFAGSQSSIEICCREPLEHLVNALCSAHLDHEAALAAVGLATTSCCSASCCVPLIARASLLVSTGGLRDHEIMYVGCSMLQLLIRLDTSKGRHPEHEQLATKAFYAIESVLNVLWSRKRPHVVLGLIKACFEYGMAANRFLPSETQDSPMDSWSLLWSFQLARVVSIVHELAVDTPLAQRASTLTRPLLGHILHAVESSLRQGLSSAQCLRIATHVLWLFDDAGLHKLLQPLLDCPSSGSSLAATHLLVAVLDQLTKDAGSCNISGEIFSQITTLQRQTGSTLYDAAVSRILQRAAAGERDALRGAFEHGRILVAADDGYLKFCLTHLNSERAYAIAALLTSVPANCLSFETIFNDRIASEPIYVLSPILMAYLAHVAGGSGTKSCASLRRKQPHTRQVLRRILDSVIKPAIEGQRHSAIEVSSIFKISALLVQVQAPSSRVVRSLLNFVEHHGEAAPDAAFSFLDTLATAAAKPLSSELVPILARALFNPIFILNPALPNALSGIVALFEEGNNLAPFLEEHLMKFAQAAISSKCSSALNALLSATKVGVPIMGHSNELWLSLFEQARKAMETTEDHAAALCATILLEIARGCPAVLTADQLPELMQLYNASLSATDVCIFELFQEYEQQDINIGELALLWGPGSVSTRITVEDLTIGNVASALVTEACKILDPTRTRATLVSFPASRTFTELGSSIPEDRKTVFDPAFILPLCLQLVESGSLDLRSFVERGALGLAVLGLSCTDEVLRSIAYQTVGSFFAQLEDSKFRERAQVQLPLQALRNAIEEPNQHVPSMICCFVSRAVQLALHPNDDMYKIVNKFLLQRPALDLGDIPLFYQLLHSNTRNHRGERIWLLKLLHSGMRLENDFHVLRRRHALDLLLSFSTASFCDKKTRDLIFNFVQQAMSVPGVSISMVQQHGILGNFQLQVQRLGPQASTISFLTMVTGCVQHVLQHVEDNARIKDFISEECQRTLSVCLAKLADSPSLAASVAAGPLLASLQDAMLRCQLVRSSSASSAGRLPLADVLLLAWLHSGCEPHLAGLRPALGQLLEPGRTTSIDSTSALVTDLPLPLDDAFRVAAVKLLAGSKPYKVSDEQGRLAVATLGLWMAALLLMIPDSAEVQFHSGLLWLSNQVLAASSIVTYWASMPLDENVIGGLQMTAMLKAMIVRVRRLPALELECLHLVIFLLAAVVKRSSVLPPKVATTLHVPLCDYLGRFPEPGFPRTVDALEQAQDTAMLLFKTL